MSEPASLIATAKLRVGCDQEFAVWKARHDSVLAEARGFISCDIMPSAVEGSREWTFVMNFASADDVDRWQKSPERAAVIAAGLPLFEDGNLGEVVRGGGVASKADGSVTEVIFSRVIRGKEDAYRKWSARIQLAQSKYPGYQGMFLQPPDKDGEMWTSIIRFDSAAHLEAWMAAPERKKLLRESKEFIAHEQLTRLATSFPGWVPIDPATGEGPPNWKTAMLVLLGLFPVVMLELRFLNPILGGLGLHASLATFIGNLISVAVTSFATMPLCVRGFGWWLFLNGESDRFTTVRGVAVLVVLYAIEVLVLWKLLPW